MSTAPADTVMDSVPAALDSAADLLASVGPDWWRLSDGDLRTSVDGCAALIARAQGLLLSLVAEVQASGVPARDGAPTTAAWLRARLRMTPRDARHLASVAEVTRGPLSATGVALAAGRLNLAQAAAVCEAVKGLPQRVEAELRVRVEADLIERAAHFDALALSRLGRGILSMLAPEIGEAPEAAELERGERRAAARSPTATGHRTGAKVTTSRLRGGKYVGATSSAGTTAGALPSTAASCSAGTTTR